MPTFRTRLGVCFIALSTLAASPLRAACEIISSAPHAQRFANEDVLALSLRSRSECPQTVFALRDLLTEGGLALQTTLVANRGFHNQDAGSFSFFEMATGTWHGNAVPDGAFFFGHFAELEEGILRAQQDPTSGALVMELIAWDPNKNLFNFYELRGLGSEAQWYYRGDTSDVRDDTRNLHRVRAKGQPVFGDALRCSGCHGHGGPIMKEMAEPYNDWWRPQRPLPRGGAWDPRLQPFLENLVDANVLARAVESGERRLFARPQERPRTLQERLRPLFCPVEVNLASSPRPNDASDTLEIPSGFFVDERLGSVSVRLSKQIYDELLDQLRLHFPESARADADHPWLTPVKAASDIIAIDRLIQEGLVTHAEVSRILAVDFQDPVFSASRCSLLTLVPDDDAQAWQPKFYQNVIRAAVSFQESTLRSGARAFLEVAQQPDAARWVMRQVANLEKSVIGAEDAAEMMRRLLARRAAILTSEISQNPRGQIAEPGFRIIFPESD